MKKIITLGLFTALFALCACSINVNTTLNNAKPISFEIIKQETYGGREKASNVVITSYEQLEDLYNELGWQNVPQVDFTTQNVLAAFMGQKNTGGYSIGIKKVSVDGNTTTVTVYETKPEPGGLATTALTAPYCIAVIPKTENTEVVK